MIVTITPAPAIDWTIAVDSFELDAVNRIVSGSREPSGKGLNVSWALHRVGKATKAVFPAGGASGDLMRETLAEAGLPHVIIDTGRDVRTNITLVSPGHSTKLNEAGTYLDEEQVAQFRAAIIEACRDAEVALVCGSLPPGVSDSFQSEVVADLLEIGVPTIVDTFGSPLEKALPAGPELIKPNVHELADLVGQRIGTLGEVETAAREAIRRGAKAVLASLGADGSLLVTADEALFGHAHDIPFVNSVGAGDALLSGYVGGGPENVDRLRNAILWASSAVAHATTLFPIREDFNERIEITASFDRAQALAEPSLALVYTK
ncbi:1-phosphofructokinase family hexose kinase [Actinomycetaceae bacterium L2_0104]